MPQNKLQTKPDHCRSFATSPTTSTLFSGEREGLPGRAKPPVGERKPTKRWQRQCGSSFGGIEFLPPTYAATTGSRGRSLSESREPVLPPMPLLVPVRYTPCYCCLYSCWCDIFLIANDREKRKRQGLRESGRASSNDVRPVATNMNSGLQGSGNQHELVWPARQTPRRGMESPFPSPTPRHDVSTSGWGC